MKKIINLTQHTATAEQLKEGVVEPLPKMKEEIKKLLIFDDLPSTREIKKRAKNLVLKGIQIYSHLRLEERDTNVPYACMIGGAPFLMTPLVLELKKEGITSLFAFSKRESVEKIIDGKTVKTSVFKHLGFVEAV